MDTDQLLAQARTALSRALPDVDAEQIVVMGGTQSRRRSDVLFLGLSDEAPTRRWVLKVPRPQSRQHDLGPPLDADGQVRALQRLDAHLSPMAEAFVPRVVAVLPSVGGYVMEYVDGAPLTAHFGLRALLDDGEVVRGAIEAARVLRLLHALEPAAQAHRDLAEIRRSAVSQAEQVLTRAGLPVRAAWLESAPLVAAATGTKVLLHGDFAPENIVLAVDRTYCLDADLVERDWAEHDVIRFLLMLCDAPLFVVLGDVPAARRLRRRAANAFVGSYYGDGAPDPALRPLMLSALATRWATRHGDVVAGRPPLARARLVLLRRHFTRLLDELAAPDWPADGC
ncbi:MAG TPA: phosphotransferase [Marmoricola sp.]|jgi:hypothetical protein|nr:phosphotransferase [Marmoricola sp.]